MSGQCSGVSCVGTIVTPGRSMWRLSKLSFSVAVVRRSGKLILVLREELRLQHTVLAQWLEGARPRQAACLPAHKQDGNISICGSRDGVLKPPGAFPNHPAALLVDDFSGGGQSICEGLQERLDLVVVGQAVVWCGNVMGEVSMRPGRARG